MDDVLRQQVKDKIEDHVIGIIEALFDGADPAANSLSSPLCFSRIGAREAHQGAQQLAGLLKVLRTSYTLLTNGATATQRELYYMNADFFNDQDEAQIAIALATSALKIPSHRLGLFAAARGWFAGAVVDIVDEDSVQLNIVKATKFMSPRPVPSTAVSEQVAVTLSDDCQFILIVEKECIFRRLVEDKIWEQPGMSCCIVTGCGFPDLATRSFAHQLWRRTPTSSSTPAYPHASIPVYGLCDWNVFGLGVLLSYTRASKSHPESGAWAVPVQWLGLHAADIDTFALPAAALQASTAVDEARARAMLKDATVAARPGLQAEIHAWLASGEKMELEGILSRGIGFLSNVFLPTKIQQVQREAREAQQRERERMDDGWPEDPFTAAERQCTGGTGTGMAQETGPAPLAHAAGPAKHFMPGTAPRTAALALL